MRARIIADDPYEALLPPTGMMRQHDTMYELGKPPGYEPALGTSIGDRAVREGRTGV